MQDLIVLKIGGETLNSQASLEACLEAIAKSGKRVVLIHGGGRKLESLAHKLGVTQQMVEGRRMTSKETLELCTMVYGGLINKNVVAKLASYGIMALGLSGADLGAIRSKKRLSSPIDFGYVGDVVEVNGPVFSRLIESQVVPVVCSLSMGENYELLNTNADTMAAEIAIELAKTYRVRLGYGFEKQGVLLDVLNENSLISELKEKEFRQLKGSGQISEGMIPKLDTAFRALSQGVEQVSIVHSVNLENFLFSRPTGTCLKLT